MRKRIVRIARWFFVAGLGMGLCSCGKGPVAVVNGQKISARDYYAFAGKGKNGAQALMGVVLERMLLQAAQKAGVTVSEKEIDDAISEDRESLKEVPNAPSLEEVVRGEYLAWEEYRWETRLKLLLEKLCTKDVQVTDEKVKSYFEQNRQRLYDKPDRADLHVMVLPREKEAQEARQQLLQGEPFEKVAQDRRSLEFQSAGGAVAQVERGSAVIPAAVFDAAWKLNVGEMTSPVKQGEKYYLARLDEKFPADKADYETIKDRVRTDFLRDNGTPPQLFIIKLRDDAKVEILWNQFTDLEKQLAASRQPAATPVRPATEQEATKPGPPPVGKTPPTKGNAPPTGR